MVKCDWDGCGKEATKPLRLHSATVDKTYHLCDEHHVKMKKTLKDLNQLVDEGIKSLKRDFKHCLIGEEEKL
jgi:hypothetical protein